MTCQSCHKKTARVHLTEIGSKMKKEIHLCEDCARQHEASLPHAVGSSGPPDAMGPPEVELGKIPAGAEPAAICSACGISFAEFRSTGRLGCPDDYESFRKDLKPILDRIHGTTRHRGRIPPQAGKAAIRQRELLKLNDELQRAVKEEKYEEAARIRDKLNELRGDVDAD